MSTALELESDPLGCIMVATDFSDTAALALERALDIAQRHGSEIALVHVMQPDLPPLAAPEMVVIPPNYEDVLRDACIGGLDHAAETVRAAGVAVSQHLERGRPARRIASVANSLAADLILMGTRGNTGFKHLLLGSVAEEVVRIAQRPVLIVHPGDQRPIEPVKRLLFPTDFSAASDQALSVALRLLIGSEETKIFLLHTYQIAPAVVPLGGFGGGVAPLFVENAQELAEQATQPSVKALRSRGFDVEVLVERGDPAEIINERAAEYDVDLIVMGTRGHSKIRQILLGSTAERVVEHAPCPVLTVHELDPASI
jgi:nucleotide-binding universal stress UspA family protein